jgi:hypothetical protein
MTAIARRTDSNIAVPAIIVWSVIVAAAVAALKSEALPGGTALLSGSPPSWRQNEMELSEHALCARAKDFGVLAQLRWRTKMTKLMAGVVALAVSVAAAAAMAQTSVAPESQLMATPSASDESVRNSVMAAAKAAPPKESQPNRNSMMNAPGSSSNSPAMASQPSVAAVRGVAPR